MTNSIYHDSPRQPFAWLIFWLAALTAVGFFFIPGYVIWPFRHQTASALKLAMALRQRAPIPTMIAAVVCILLVLFLWESHNLRRKIVLSGTLLVVVFSAVMSRLNYFEWMFHLVKEAEFENESASKLSSSEMILAIRFGDDARAYPISQMAYHHILNDVVGNVPVAVTY